MYEAIEGNTLVIEILAKNLTEINQNETFYSLADLIADIQKKGLLQLSEQSPIRTDWQQSFEKTAPENIIRAMYDLRPLSDEELYLLSNFSVLPPENIAYQTFKELLQPENPKQFSDTLTLLYRKGWVDKNILEGQKYYKISPVVQEIVRERNKERLWRSCGKMIFILSDKLNWQNNSSNYHQDNYKLTTLYSHYAKSIANLYLGIVHGKDFTIMHNIGVLCERIGYFYATTGNLNKALNFYEQQNEISKQLVTQSPRNLEYKNSLAISYSFLGNTSLNLGNLNKALNNYEKLNQLSKELYEENSKNYKFKNDYAISYSKLGYVHEKLGNLDKLLRHYEEMNNLFQELHTDNPINEVFKNGLAISHEKLGNAHSILGNLEKALAYYEKYNQLEKELYDSYPANVSFKKSFAISCEKLGTTYRTMNNIEKALYFFTKNNQLLKELYDAYPSNVNLKDGLAISYEKLGDINFSFGNVDKMLAYYEESNRLSKELYTTYPNNVEFKNNLAISYIRLGSFYKKTDVNKAKAYHLESQKLLAELVQISPAYAEFQKNLKWVENRLAGL